MEEGPRRGHYTRQTLRLTICFLHYIVCTRPGGAAEISGKY